MTSSPAARDAASMRRGAEVPAYAHYADAVLSVLWADAFDESLDNDGQQDLEAAQNALVEDFDTDSMFATIATNAGLELAGVQVLALLAACEMDTARAARLALIQGDTRLSRLTVGTVSRLLGGSRRTARAVGPGSALRRAALIDVEARGTWSAAEICASASVLWALAGEATLDPECPIGTIVLTADPARAHAEDEPAAVGLVVVTGPDRARRRAEAARRADGHRFLVADAPADASGWAALVREATLTGCGVIVELTDGLPIEGRWWIERAAHLSWVLTTRDPLPIRSMPSVPWREHIAQRAAASAEDWRDIVAVAPSQRHRLTADQLELVGRVLPAVDGDVDAAVRRLLAGPLGQMALRIPPSRSWADLVLPDQRLAQLRAIVDRYRFAGTVYDDWGVSSGSGRGILALFTGPSGTGKTLAAEVVAAELDLDMYKLDLASVVSKYIGETEQNLDKVFDAASAGNAVLFFDEADALLGKRSDVKDGRDRYANLEVSYLLQRLEAYDGIVLMATNLPKNIDAAFLRRLHAVVDFALPAAPERRAIWERHLGAGMPLGDIDLDALAERFEVSGGVIRNVVIGAAFRAAAAGAPVSMPALLQGLSEEYTKLGRIQKPESFNV